MEIYPKKPIKISSKAEMDCEMRRIHTLFKSKESDETWEHFNNALANVKRWIEQDKVHGYDGFAKHIKQLHDGIKRTLLSERTRLAGTAIELLKVLASHMGRSYEPLHDLFHASLVRMFAKTKKVTVQQSTECMKIIIEAAKLPRYIPRFAAIITDGKIQHNNSSMASAAACLEKTIEVNAIEAIQSHLQAVEAAIRIGITKPAAEVRASLRACYKAYQQRMPMEAARFEASLTDQAKKYLKAQTSAASAATLKRRNSNNSSTSTSSNVTLSRSSLANSRGRASLPSLQASPARPVTVRHSAPQSSLNLPARSTLQSSSSNRNRLQPTAKIVNSKPALNTAITAPTRITKRRNVLPVLSSKKIAGPVRVAIASAARNQRPAASQTNETNSSSSSSSSNRSSINSPVNSSEQQQQPYTSSNQATASSTPQPNIPQTISDSSTNESSTKPATSPSEQQHLPSDNSTAVSIYTPAAPCPPIQEETLDINIVPSTKAEAAFFTAAATTTAGSTADQSNPALSDAQSTTSATPSCFSSKRYSPSSLSSLPKRPRSALLDLKTPYKFATDNKRHIPISKPLTLRGTPTRPVKRKRPATTNHGEENTRPRKEPNLQS